MSAPIGTRLDRAEREIAKRGAIDDIATLRLALENIIKVLGPSAPKCEGCATEIAAALKIAREGLK